VTIRNLFGPWSPALADDIERRCQLRCFGGVVACYRGSSDPLIAVLRAAESGGEALDHARLIFDGLPALPQRRIISTFGAVTWPKRGRGDDR